MQILKNEAEKRGFTKITRARIVVGQLRALNLETLSFIFEAIASEDPLTEETTLEFKEKKGRVKCKNCGHEWMLQPEDLGSGSRSLLHYSGVVTGFQLTCQNCGAQDFEIIAGKELYISEIEAEREASELEAET